VISFRCVLKTQLGELISSSYNREVLTDVFESDANRLPALAHGLKNLRKGEQRMIQVPAAEAYGLYDRELVIEVSRKKLMPVGHLVIGQEVVVETEGGEQRSFRVIGLSSKRVTLDGNHPLAGQDLIFDIEATDVREATAEEVSREKTGDLRHAKWGFLH
jgi:FKBP-type peptidyl-prolyl cis-trans isomerase SlyD